jgi:hypothetical protein
MTAVFADTAPAPLAMSKVLDLLSPQDIQIKRLVNRPGTVDSILARYRETKKHWPLEKKKGDKDI